MTRKEIIHSISEDLDLTHRQTQAIVERVFGVIGREIEGRSCVMYNK